MSALHRTVFVFLVGLTVIPLMAVDASVAAPSMRQTSIDAAMRLLAPKSGIPATEVMDPFHPPTLGDAAVAPRSGSQTNARPPIGASRSDHDILVTIANGLKPRAVSMGNSLFLFFGVKKTKVGDLLTLTFEDTVYQVQITAIDHSTFTLRLNREEFTRPIKQGTAP